MMRTILCLLLLSAFSFSYAQIDERITTLDFVQIQNDNKKEAIYYYQNNWKVLREMAVKKGYIHSFQLLETPGSEDAPFQLILITTYGDARQYALREDNFGELIEARGDLRLLNEKQPGDFRKIIFHKEDVRHLE